MHAVQGLEIQVATNQHILGRSHMWTCVGTGQGPTGALQCAGSGTLLEQALDTFAVVSSPKRLEQLRAPAAVQRQ
jgi:hypothetical protein